MKIEKLNLNTLKIVLSVEELSSKNITIKDIENGKKKAQKFFFDIIEDSCYASDFLQDDTRLLVEATVGNDNTLNVTLTKLQNVTPIPLNTNSKLTNTHYMLYAFYDLATLLDFVMLCTKDNLFVGQNSIYLYDNIYILLFSKATVQQVSFKKTYYALTEYSDKYTSKPALISYIKENGQLLLGKNAIGMLSCYTLE